MSKIPIKRALELPLAVKLAFLAGASVGVTAFRGGLDLGTLAKLDIHGSDSFAALFTNQVTDPLGQRQALEFFDEFHNFYFGAKDDNARLST